MPTNDPHNPSLPENPPLPPAAPAIAATNPAQPDPGRRSFFTDSLREAATPLSWFIDRKITPLLNALTQLPAEIEIAVGPLSPTRTPLDQLSPTADPRSLPLYPPASIPERFLRPPGACLPKGEIEKTENAGQPEAERGEFESLCSRCGKCVEVCPAKAIQLDRTGLIADGLPYIVPQEMPCVLCDSLACMHNCPTGALQLVDKFHIRMGLAHVDHNLCRRSHAEDCRVCVQSCPLGETAITISPHTNHVLVKSQGCTGCGLCEHSCPTDPRAIIVHPSKEKTTPILA